MPVINFRPPPLRPIFRVPQAKISPVFRPVFRPILRPNLRPVLPKVQPILRATLRPIVQPIVRIRQAAARPIIRPVIRQPIFRPIIRAPIVRVQQAAAQRPLVRPILRPVIRPVLHTNVRPVVRVVQQPPVTGGGHLAELVREAIGRLLPPLQQLRGEGLRLQSVAVAQLSAARGGFARLAADTARFDTRIIAAELRSGHPAEELRRDEARYAAAAGRQRERLIRSSDRQLVLLRRIAKKSDAPLPGHGKTPHGKASQDARRNAHVGGHG